jgi:hypothetical protein
VWIAVGILTVLAAGVAVLIADTLSFVDCASEASSECSDAGRHQRIAAYLVLLPAIGTLVSSLRSRGRPKLWFFAAAVLYGLWIALAVRSSASPP